MELTILQVIAAKAQKLFITAAAVCHYREESSQWATSSQKFTHGQAQFKIMNNGYSARGFNNSVYHKMLV